MIKDFSKFLNEKIVAGSGEGFEDLNDSQQLIFLVFKGILGFNYHMNYVITINEDKSADILVGRKNHDWSSKKDAHSSKVIDEMLQVLSLIPDFKNKVEWTKGNRLFKILP